MPKKLTALFAVLLLAAAGGCGDDADTASTVEDNDASGEQLTEEEFLERGDAICGELDVALGLIESPRSQEDFAEYLTEVRGPVEAARESWELLEPPNDGKDVHQAMLDSLTDGLEALNGAITAAESGDTVTAEDLLAEADRAGDEVDEQAQAYGFEECGKPDADEQGSSEAGGGGTSDDEPLAEEPDPEPVDPPRDDEPMPEEPDPAPVDDPQAEDQPGDPKP